MNIKKNTDTHYYQRVTIHRYSVFFSLILRNRAAVSLFWDFWAPYRLLSDHKIGRKLPFGKKHHLMGFRNIQEDDCLKEEFLDEPV